MSQSAIDLPDYRIQAPQVAARFQRLKARPVVLEVSALQKCFPSPQRELVALQNIDFSVHRREFMCVIGASGCGKSTLIRILAGLETPTAGEVLLDKKRVSGPGPERGMVFQGYTLFPWLSVKQNVMFGLKMTGHSSSQAEPDARQWIEMVGLAKFENSFPHQLSGGMKQRVAIARALANQPRVLLMDEPFGALDAQTRAVMQDNLLELRERINATIVFVTHDIDEAILLSDRVLIMSAGPGRILKDLQVSLPRPRSSAIVAEAAYLTLKRDCLDLIRSEGRRAFEQMEIKA